MRAEGPVQRVRGRREVREEGDGCGERGEFGERDGWEAVVGECAGEKGTISLVGFVWFI